MSRKKRKFINSFPARIILPLLIVICSTVAGFSAEVQRLKFESTALQISKTITIIVPKSYATSTNRHYPVVYFLNGYSGNDQQFPEGTPLAQLVDRYEIIAACPDGGSNNWYIDSPIHPENKYETFIWRDVVVYMDAHFRTRAASADRGITGMSMGGHGAMFIGLRHPDIFGAVASMSGGLDIRPFPDSWDITHWLGNQDQHPENWNSHTVINLLDQVTPGRQKIFFDCGTNDFFLAVNRATDKAMTRLGITHTYQEFPGGHNMAFWKIATERHMKFFHEAFVATAIDADAKVIH